MCSYWITTEWDELESPMLLGNESESDTDDSYASVTENAEKTPAAAAQKQSAGGEDVPMEDAPGTT